MKNLPYFIVGMLLLSGFAALVIGEESGFDKEKTVSIQFLEPKITKNGMYMELNIEGANAHSYHADEPILPVYTTSLSFPFGTKIVDIKCEKGKVESMVLSHKIAPAPKPVIQGTSANVLEREMNITIYNSYNLFPDGWFEYYTGAGLDANNEHKIFLTLRVYPVRYNPAMDTIYYVENFDLKITYEEPDADPFPENSAYDMVIIAPSIFSDDLQDLVNHKNSFGVNTMLKTTEDIYDQYPGVDKPEQIKYFIKDALDNWDIKYVMLVGGLKSSLFGNSKDDENQGTKDWYVPVRYTNHQGSDGSYDPGFISDLYYADIYDGGGSFSNWDSNGDGTFAKWNENSLIGRDNIDFYPDVYVGRLACRNNFEVKIMVNKIINYEKEPADSSWYDRILFVAGDSHNDSDSFDFIEGELTCDKILGTYMTDFNPIKLYASYKDTDPQHTPEPANFLREMSTGCGFLLFDGHAKPNSWSTHWLFRSGGGWTKDIAIYDFPNLQNGGKLPVCVVGGCHSNQINVTLLATLLDKPKMWTYGEPTPECFSWWITRKIGGGSIATIGNTGLGIGWVGGESDLNGDGIDEPVCIEGLGGYQQILFYKTYSESGSGILGEAWGGAQREYLDAFPGMGDFVDAKTVEQWLLLGDPSLKIGGYS